MAICKKKKFNSVIWFRLPSKTSDVDCADGEVASFRNVDWLADTTSTSGNSAGSTSGPNSPSSSSPASETKLRLISEPTDIMLPHGSRLLAIHSPENLHGRKNYIFVTAADTLAIYSSGGGISNLPVTLSRIIGNIRNILVHGDIIMIIGDNSSGYILYDPHNAKYSFTIDPPCAPAISFSITPAHVERYTLMAGALPQLTVSLDLPLSVAGSLNALSNWLDDGHSSAVTEETIERVYKAVGSAVEKYSSEMTAMGYLLTPTIGIATLDDTLPTFPVEIDTNYQPPYAILQSWSYNAEKLILNLSFSLLPLSLSANFQRSDNDKIWDPQFASLQFHLSEQMPWRRNPSDTLKANGYTSFIDPDTSFHAGFAFRFPSISAAEMREVAARMENLKFRTTGKVQLGNVSAGTTSLRCIRTTDPVFVPNYDDNTIARPTAGVSIDSGFILWGGEADIPDAQGGVRNISLEKKILVSHPAYPMIFRHICDVGEGSVVAVTQGNGSRTTGDTGRHPLYVVSTDGVRRLAANGEGGYMNANLVSREGAIPESLTAQSSDRSYYITPTGIQSIALDGSRKKVTSYPIEEDWQEMRILRDNEVILFRSPGRAQLISIADGNKFDITGISVRPICESEGVLYMTENTGTVSTLKSERYYSIEQKEDDLDEDTSKIAEFREQASPIISLTTRPLKIDSPLSYKAIHDIRSLSPDIQIRLEGSDDIQKWDIIAEFKGSIGALRARPYRFFRLTLSTTSSPILLRCIEVEGLY